MSEQDDRIAELEAEIERIKPFEEFVRKHYSVLRTQHDGVFSGKMFIIDQAMHDRLASGIEYDVNDPRGFGSPDLLCVQDGRGMYCGECASLRPCEHVTSSGYCSIKKDYKYRDEPKCDNFIDWKQTSIETDGEHHE